METPKSANCPEFLKNLDRLIDGQMSIDEEKSFLSSIESSFDCIEKLEMERAYKEFLAQKLERKCCSQSMLSSIQECLKKEE